MTVFYKGIEKANAEKKKKKTTTTTTTTTTRAKT